MQLGAQVKHGGGAKRVQAKLSSSTFKALICYLFLNEAAELSMGFGFDSVCNSLR